MSSNPVSLTFDADVATVTLHSTAPRNALNHAAMQALRDIARQLNEHPSVRAVVLRGHGRDFTAGVDLAILEALGEQDLLQRRHSVRQGPDMCDAWAAIEVPTIAAIEGPCIGGGLALALSCDFRVLGEAALLRLPEVPLGMNMSWHSLPRLTALVGPARAKRIAMGGEAVRAAQAMDWGLADHVVDNGQATARAQAWAHELAALPPVAVRMTKQTISAISEALAPLATHMDRDQFLLAAQSQDLAEGVAAFKAQRAPQFHGR
jgi:enoyl-CoA hydratase/carnithine racemase